MSTKRQKITALAISVPSLLAVVLLSAGKIAEGMGQPFLESNRVIGVAFFATLVLVPVSTAVVVFWAIASWANHGRVPPQLLVVAAANAAVFWYLYRLTHI